MVLTTQYIYLRSEHKVANLHLLIWAVHFTLMHSRRSRIEHKENSSLSILYGGLHKKIRNRGERINSKRRKREHYFDVGLQSPWRFPKIEIYANKTRKVNELIVIIELHTGLFHINEIRKAYTYIVYITYCSLQIILTI